MINKKAQAWGFDLIIALILFFIGVTLLFLYIVNSPSTSKEKIDDLNYEGENVISQILSEGYPQDWNSTKFVQIGIITENKINETKLGFFYNLSTENYPLILSLFNTKYDFFFNLSQQIIIDNVSIKGIGKEPSSYTNIIKITRFTIYKDKPVSAELLIWE